MRRTLETEVTIAAPRSRVWAILMDFKAYPDWNPFILSIKGEARVGEMLEVVIQPPSHKAGTFVPRVLALETDRRFQATEQGFHNMNKALMARAEDVGARAMP